MLVHVFGSTVPVGGAARELSNRHKLTTFVELPTKARGLTKRSPFGEPARYWSLLMVQEIQTHSAVLTEQTSASSSAGSTSDDNPPAVGAGRGFARPLGEPNLHQQCPRRAETTATVFPPVMRKTGTACALSVAIPSSFVVRWAESAPAHPKRVFYSTSASTSYRPYRGHRGLHRPWWLGAPVSG